MTEFNEQKIAHLSLIQGVIVRMGSNAFSLKALAVTIAAAAIALAGARPSGMEIFPLAGLLPVVLFWWMDAQYVHIEKCYRELYNAVRKDKNVEAFCMDYKPYKKDVEGVVCISVWNWSVTPFFGTVSFVLIVAYYFLK
jgi:hypothetical protein